MSIPTGAISGSKPTRSWIASAATGADMKRADVNFIVVVAIFTVVCCGMYVSGLEEVFLDSSGTGATFSAAGQPRDVDLLRVKALMRRGYLSDHEAEFYHPVEEAGPAQDFKAAP